jgi:hypothetical protein
MMAIIGGSKAMVHVIQVILDVHPNWVVLQIDVINVFNTNSWNVIFYEFQVVGSQLF